MKQTYEIVLSVPMSRQVTIVLAKAEEVGLTLVGVTTRMGTSTTLRFERNPWYVEVTFDHRGDIRQAGGRSPDANNWMIFVNHGRPKMTPREALDVLVNETLPSYAEVAA